MQKQIENGPQASQQWPEDWETKSITDEQFAALGLMHWSVPEDLAIQYIEKLGWRKAYDLDLEASEGLTTGNLVNPRAYVRSMVKDELGVGAKSWRGNQI